MKKFMMIAVLALMAPIASADEQAQDQTQTQNEAAQGDTSAAAVEIIEVTEEQATDASADAQAGTENASTATGQQ